MQALTEYPQIEKAIIFGSRAMGNYKRGSDIDLAIMGKEITFEITSRLHGKLNEQLSIPYIVDVVNFNNIDNEQLRHHILNEGKIFFEQVK